jgi:hypothetical protein
MRSERSVLAALCDCACDSRTRVGANAYVLKHVHHSHAINHLTKCNVLAVKPVAWRTRDEELHC